MATNLISGAEAMVRMLQLHGVDIIFGLCGDTTLPFYDALYRMGDNVTHVLTRDERHAGYMADAYARMTGKVGVCEGPSGGGATYILPGLVEANESSIPVLAITTDISVSSRGRYALTELDQEALFGPLTKSSQVIDRGEDVPRAVRHAFTEMTTGRPGAAHLGFPFDVQRAPVEEDEIWADPDLGRYPARPVGPDPKSVEAAARAISEATRPLIVCGGGVVIAGAEDELERLAKKIDAPVATTISGQGSISDEHPLALGVVGSNGGTAPTRAVVDGADLIVFVACRAGSVTTERWQHPRPGAVRIVHIDVDPDVIGANYAAEAAVVGDAKLALAALANAVEEAPGGEREQAARDIVSAARKEKFEAFRKLAASDAVPILPERIVADLQDVLPPDAVLVADPGTPCPYLSAFYEQRRTGRNFISNRAHGALGYSLPAVVGAYYGRPGVKCVAVMGDGSFAMAMGELETIARLNLPVTLVVISNSVFGWIKAGQKTGYDERYYSVDFTRTDHATIAEGFGFKVWRVEQPHQLQPAFRAAIEAGEPTLVDIVTQPLQDANAPVSEWVA
ncbi:MAG: thiamine pyrophosphate-binding protein [Alphaproteobacteria bacterium]|nr:thiamine pyrophosphate-binding protein [Alphaproteobacteria bacterium]